LINYYGLPDTLAKVSSRSVATRLASSLVVFSNNNKKFQQLSEIVEQLAISFLECIEKDILVQLEIDSS